MTLGAAADAKVRLIVWCKECQHQVEPDPADMAARYGADTPVPDWRDRLVCCTRDGALRWAHSQRARARAKQQWQRWAPASNFP
jgi:hypothetical protein